MQPAGRARRALLTAVALSLAACTGPAQEGGVGVGPDEVPRHHPAPAPAAAPAGDATGLAVQLAEALGTHALLAGSLVRESAVDAGAVRPRSDAASDSARTVAGLLGRSGGVDRGTEQALRSELTAAVAYARTVGAGDTEAAAFRRAAVLTSARAVADRLGAFAGPAATAQVRAAVERHAGVLLAEADARAAGDHSRTFRLQRAGLQHLSGLADPLALGVARRAGLPRGTTSTPRDQLTRALGSVLAEHMGVVTEVMRTAADRSPAAAASQEALNANTTEIAGAVRSLFGEAAARGFLDIWAQHVEALVGYGAALGNGDAAAQAAAQQELDRYVTRFARFLATATDRRLSPIAVAAAVDAHDKHLVAQADAWAGGDRAASDAALREGLGHMAALAGTLGTAFAQTVAARLPAGGADTGGTAYP